MSRKFFRSLDSETRSLHRDILYNRETADIIKFDGIEGGSAEWLEAYDSINLKGI